MLKIQLLRSYRKAGGTTVFVYSVSGTESNLAKYKDIQGEFYREDEDGGPIWFTGKFVGKVGKLIITSKDKIVADTSELDQAASLASQYGGNLGNALATTYATKFVGEPGPIPAGVMQPITPVDHTDKLD
jgi:hypothetical protein